MQILLELTIALRYSRAKGRKRFLSFISWAAIITISVSIMTLVTVLSVMNGFETSLREHMLSGISDVTLRNVSSEVLDWSHVVTVAEADSRVKAAAPFMEIQGFIQGNGKSGAGVAIRAIAPELESNVTDFGKHMIQGALSNLNQRDKIVLGKALAAKLNVKVNDKVVILIPRGSMSLESHLPVAYLLKVVGIFDMGLEDFDAELALVNINQFNDGLHIQASSGVALRVSRLDVARPIAQALSDRLGQSFHVQTWMDSSENIFTAIAMEKKTMFVILSLIVLVAVVNLVSMLMMMVTDKQSEIAILRTLGSSPGDIMRIFVFQGLLVGAAGISIGGVSGCILSLWLPGIAAWIEKISGVHFLSADIYSISVLPSELRLQDVVSVVVVGFLLSLAATLYPSFKAARMPPAEALRYE